MKPALPILVAMLLCAPASAAEATRADLARSFLEFEAAYRAHPPEDDAVAQVNRAFDRATIRFFRGSYSDACRDLDALAARLRGETGPHPARAVKVTIDAPVRIAKHFAVLELGIDRVYGDGPLPDGLEIVVRSPAGEVVAKRPLPAMPDEVKVALDPAELPPGEYRVEVGVPAARFFVVPEDIDLVRTRNAKRLKDYTAETPEMIQAHVSCRARNGLLRSRPSEIRNAEMLADPVAFAKEVDAEIDAILAGRNPYRGRLGDTWRTLLAGATEIPLRVYAPTAAAEDGPLPLVVALHGAGADENAFFFAYGSGLLKRLADEHGFLAATPHTVRISTRPTTLDTVIETLAREYRIDRDRIYVLGHSLGAMATSVLARSRKETLAAACLIAGGRITSPDKTCPTLHVFGGLDPIFKAPEAADDPRVLVYPHHGHTLLVNDTLPRVVGWLLEQRRTRK